VHQARRDESQPWGNEGRVGGLPKKKKKLSP
jgi:hypothetical protein